MDQTPTKGSDSVIIDIGCCENTVNVGSPPPLSEDKIRNIASFNIDRIVKAQKPVDHSGGIRKAVDDLSSEPGKKNKGENRKSTSAKKPTKPPRPPRGLSLDAADQKLIKELSELAMIKRARIERMKALKKMKEAKASSISASSSGNLMAILFTLLFCVVIIFQGCHPVGSSPRTRSVIAVPSSVDTITGVNNVDALVGSAVLLPLPDAKSPNRMVEQAPATT